MKPPKFDAKTPLDEFIIAVETVLGLIVVEVR